MQDLVLGILDGCVVDGLIAKFSPSFSFSWAEKVLILNFTPPTPRKVRKWSNTARRSKAKLNYLTS